MYSYGWDPECVGVDGIVTCMGVFLRYEKDLYALHAPFNGAKANERGKDDFVAYVKRETKGGAFIGGLKNAELIAVVNGNPRGDVTDEIKGYCKGLGTSSALVYQLSKNLGQSLNSQEAATIIWQQVSKRNCSLKYRKHSDTTWQKNVGRVRQGWYGDNSSFTDNLTTDPDGPGWHVVDSTNSNITEVRA
jgi:hypothetical protein